MLVAMNELQRITTEYIEAEDRLRLAGQVAEGQPVVLWLTQRLLLRLVPHLCGWLEKQTSAGAPVEIVQGFAQQAALASLESAEPVRPPEETVGALVLSVDLTTSARLLVMQFKIETGGEAVASLAFEARPLRQWLGIVHGRWLAAGWPAGPWPDWLVEAKAPRTASRMTAVLH